MKLLRLVHNLLPVELDTLQFRDHRSKSNRVKSLICGLDIFLVKTMRSRPYFSASAVHTHTRPFNGPFSGTTRVSRYQKGKPIRILVKQETVSGSGISWAIYKSAPRSRQITTPAPHHSVFYRPDSLPVAQPTASKRWRDVLIFNASIKHNINET